jgi:hypothetical protein
MTSFGTRTAAHSYDARFEAMASAIQRIDRRQRWTILGIFLAGFVILVVGCARSGASAWVSEHKATASAMAQVEAYNRDADSAAGIGQGKSSGEQHLLFTIIRDTLARQWTAALSVRASHAAEAAAHAKAMGEATRKLEAEQKAVAKLKADAQSGFRRFLYSVAGLCVLGVVGGVVLIFCPLRLRAWGMAVALGSAAGFVLTVTVAQSILALAVLAFGVVAIVLASLAYAAWIYFRGTWDNVRLIEAIKPHLTDEQRIEFFGDGPDVTRSIAWGHQSERTEQIVEQVRAGLRQLAAPVKGAKQ